MRLLFVTHNYPRRHGDRAGGFVATLASAAAARGDDVLVVAPHAAGARRSEIMDGVRVERFRYAPDWAERVAYRGDLHRRALRDASVTIALPAFFAAFRHAVRRHAAGHAPDIVHAHWWFPGGWLASSLRAPVIITCHGSDVQLLRRAPMRALARRTFARARAVTTVSTFLADRLRTALGPDAGEPRITPLPVDPVPFERAATEAKATPARILYAGNLIESKGVTVLLEAAAMLRRDGHEFRLELLGEGPLRESLERQAAALGLTDIIEWGAFVARDQMPGAYARATITVLPSTGEEGLGLTLVESLLAGTAVVGAARGGITDVVQDERTGLLARPGDVGDLARQLGRLLADPALRTQLASAGRRHALERHAPANALRRFFDLYDSFAAGE